MLKVGLITHHRVTNYGSVLQTYASQRALTALGVEVLVIDYASRAYQRESALKQLLAESRFTTAPRPAQIAFQLASLPDVRHSYTVFDHFRSRYLALSRRASSAADLQQLLPAGIDAFCTGSDQVWNPRSGRYPGGVDPAYFLSFTPEPAFRFSLSSTFGVQHLTTAEVQAIRPCLDRYTRLSVRDASSLSILHDMGLLASLTLDPTALLTAEQWTHFAHPPADHKPYILIYQLHQDGFLDEYAHRLARSSGLRIRRIAFFWRNALRGERVAYLPSPEEFVGLIDNAAMVVTDSFHGTVLSSLLHTPFISIPSDPFANRLSEFLDSIGLSSRLARQPANSPLIDEIIDWPSVDRRLSAQRRASLRWLAETLDLVPPS